MPHSARKSVAGRTFAVAATSEERNRLGYRQSSQFGKIEALPGLRASEWADEKPRSPPASGAYKSVTMTELEGKAPPPAFIWHVILSSKK
jgi:hypothetical protein